MQGARSGGAKTIINVYTGDGWCKQNITSQELWDEVNKALLVII